MNTAAASRLDRRTFLRFCELTRDKTGVSLKDGKEALVGARIAKRMRRLGLLRPRDYLRYLESDADECRHFVDSITTHYTSFLREADHFDHVARALRERRAAGQERFRLWSAAASTGEEPYSLAMTLRDLPELAGCDVKILATDISEGSLARARAGVYAQPQLRPVPLDWRERHFEAAGEGTLRVRAEVRKMVAFHPLNLTQPPYPMHGPFDVIFCRNVMIYFDPLTRATIVRAMAELLRPGGLLISGHSESLTGLKTKLKMLHPSIYAAHG